MRDNPIQFATTREDPAIERALIDRNDARRVLLVASGGCTGLALGAARPDLELTLFDSNAAQLDLARRKLGALREGRRGAALWTIGVDDPNGLNACGNFESLFRSLRRFVEDLIVPRDELRAAFEGRLPFAETVERIVTHAWWPIAFDAHFSDGLLEAMFGGAAIQHAPPGSYPRHFQRVMEAGLARSDAQCNRFLHHVLLGHYLDSPTTLPPYLVAPPAPTDPEFVLGPLEEVQGLERFDLLSLSNITDWMNHAEIGGLAQVLNECARPGAVVLLRMLNTPLPLAEALGPRWSVDETLAASLHAHDRSLFYSSLMIATKQ
jgi:S-adenosylmethionine-diacylglycerol 3-amino-3-carboxypropyl transferase